MLGAEHFLDSVKEMHCAAAPIHDVRGHLAGVLDISSECIPFAFDAAAIVGLLAGAIENRLLVAQSTEQLVIRFQVAAELLDSTMVGLVGIDVNGRLAWQNGVARSLLGGLFLPGRQREHQPERTPDEGLGLAWTQLVALPAAGAAPLALPNGLHVWARAEMRAPDGRRGLVAITGHSAGSPATALAADVHGVTTETPIAASPHEQENALPAAAAPADETTAPVTLRLRESDLDLILKTLRACGGNLSQAAKRLGVSRGLIYRRRRATGAHKESSS